MAKVVFKLPHGKTFGNINNLPRCCVAGRAPSCDLAMNLETASRIHLLLRVDDEGHLFVRDNDSKNGTFVNGDPLAPFEQNPQATETPPSGVAMAGERKFEPGTDRLNICTGGAGAPQIKFEPMEVEEGVTGFALTFVPPAKKA